MATDFEKAFDLDGRDADEQSAQIDRISGLSETVESYRERKNPQSVALIVAGFLGLALAVSALFLYWKAALAVLGIVVVLGLGFSTSPYLTATAVILSLATLYWWSMG